VLSKDPDNIKVIYRIGQSYLGMNEFEKGLDAITKGLQVRLSFVVSFNTLLQIREFGNFTSLGN